MRLQILVLLALAAVFASADASATTTKAHSIMVNQGDAPAKRLLRSDTTANVNNTEEERAAWYEGLTKLIKSNTAPKVLTNLELDNPELAKLASKKYDLNGAYKSLGLTKIKSVDDLFTSPEFRMWFSYMAHWNARSKNKPFTVAKFFSKKIGDRKAAEMFAAAAQSSNTNVKQMGEAYGISLLKQWATAGKTSKQISKTLGGDAAAAKMFATAVESSSQSERHMGSFFQNQLLEKWAKAKKNTMKSPRSPPRLPTSTQMYLLRWLPRPRRERLTWPRQRPLQLALVSEPHSVTFTCRNFKNIALSPRLHYFVNLLSSSSDWSFLFLYIGNIFPCSHTEDNITKMNFRWYRC